MTQAQHPVYAQRIGELGLDFLVNYRIARLRTPKDMAGHSRLLSSELSKCQDLASLIQRIRLLIKLAIRDIGPSVENALSEPTSVLATAIERGADADGAFERWSQEVGAVLLTHEGDQPFIPMNLLEIQLSLGVDLLLDALALAHYGRNVVLRREFPIVFPAPLLLREELPPWGEGSVEVIEVGDLLFGHWAGNDAYLKEVLGDAWGMARFRWIHGPTGLRRNTLFAAGLAEALREAAPERFWEIIERIYRWQDNVGDGITRETVAGFPVDPYQVLERAKAPDIVERVKRDYAVVTTCAVSPSRPAFVIGRKLFIGEVEYPALAAEIRRLAAG